MNFHFFLSEHGYISEIFAERAMRTLPKPVHYTRVTLELKDTERAELEAEADGMPLSAYIHQLLFGIGPDPDG